MSYEIEKAVRFCAAAGILLGCSGGDASGNASLSVLVEAEDVVIEGLQAGEGLENIQDGWSVSFDKYIVGVGAVELVLPEKNAERMAEDVFVVDLTRVPAQGLELWNLDGLRSGRWDFYYVTTIDGAERDSTVSEEDFDAMVAQDWTYLIEGTISSEGGLSCPPAALADIPAEAVPSGENGGGDPCYENPTVSFSIGAEAETTYGPCELDGVPGVAVSDEQMTTAALTIHGDHIFFNGFPEGAESGVTRLAQWLADVDLNLDGSVTQQELEAVAPDDLPQLDDRYQLGGSPITPIDSMYTYWRAQLKSQGHYQGEGECPADGVDHNHDHDHGDEHHEDGHDGMGGADQGDDHDHDH